MDVKDEMNEGMQHQSIPPSKRYRRDDNVDPTNPDPSIVVHVRNLSPKATEADLLEALSHFGPISYATCMPGKRMALVEFEVCLKIICAKNKLAQLFGLGKRGILFLQD